ncbi:AAA family ATPase [Mucilaginibacter sp.]
MEKDSLKNFKCFDELEIELGKITLLTGANSRGKSSLIYSLLGTLQSGG